MKYKPKTDIEKQSQHPNFVENGNLFLVRCFVCGDKDRGRENYLPSVATGTCAWCGWSPKGETNDKPASEAVPKTAQNEPRGSGKADRSASQNTDETGDRQDPAPSSGDASKAQGERSDS